MNQTKPSELFRLCAVTILLIAAILCVGEANAQLASNYVFEGNGNWSLDGAVLGQQATIQVPLGSKVEKAFLYASTALGIQPPPGITPQVTLGSQTYGSANFQALPFIPFPAHTTGLQAFRADVTPQISGLVGSGSASLFHVPINSATTTVGQVDGMILAVIYSNPNERSREIALLDGGSIGTQFSIDLHQPVNPTLLGFEALLSVGIGFSANTPAQRTTIAVGNRQLTAGAGGWDDGDGVGGSITVGGLGDDPTNPANPALVDNFKVLDDEYYNLALGNAQDPTPFLASSQQHLSFTTVNIGSDDNLFFVGLNVVVPEPTSISLAAILVSFGMTRRSFAARMRAR